MTPAPVHPMRSADAPPRWRRWAPTAAVLLLLPLFLYLGNWQIERAREKQRLQAEYDRRASDAVVRIEPRLQTVEALQYYRVEARGSWEPAHQILIDNRVHKGVAGYHVITPLRLAGSDVRLLVNRGWVPIGESRERLPQTPAPEGSVVVTGIATVPSDKGFRLELPPDPRGRWQTVWGYLDVKRYAAAVPFPVQPVVVLLEPQSPAGGFEREWTRLDAGVAVHHGYAFQWFALALALLVLYFLLNRRGGRKTAGGTDETSA